MFGLAQLYQIRGRVGRSRERAYAYLLYPAHAALTEEATKRLSALSDYTELGAGFKIAMRDLEIRGAGNLLGDEQSGHVAALGFELYLQMLDEAVRGWRASAMATTSPSPCASTSTSTPTSRPTTSPYEQAKIDVHRRIAAAREVADLGVLREELEDRFGADPRAAGQPDRAPAGADQARPGRGPRVSLPRRRLAVTPIELDPEQAARAAEALPAAPYEPGRAQFSVSVPEEPEQRFPAVVAAADALLAVSFAPVSALARRRQGAEGCQLDTGLRLRSYRPW